MTTKYATIIWIALTVILISVPLVYLFIWFGKKTAHGVKKTHKKIKDNVSLREIREQLESQKASLMNPSLDGDNNDIPDVVEQEVEELLAKAESSSLQELVQDTYSSNEAKGQASSPVTGEHGDVVSIDSSSEIVDIELDEKQKKYLERVVVEANFYKNEGKFEAYEKKIIEGLALDPTNMELTKMLADLYFTLGNHKKALSLLKRITEKDPEDHKSIWQIGEIYFLTGDNQTAELLVEKAVNLKPDSPKYHLSLVEIYYNTDRVYDAIACMEKIIKLRPANTNYLITLAELYEEIEDLDNAKKYYFNVLEYEPSHEKAKRKIKQYTSQ